jgi:hypothetical protein
MVKLRFSICLYFLRCSTPVILSLLQQPELIKQAAKIKGLNFKLCYDLSCNASIYQHVLFDSDS